MKLCEKAIRIRDTHVATCDADWSEDAASRNRHLAAQLRDKQHMAHVLGRHLDRCKVCSP